MEPGKHSNQANLHRTGRHDLHAPQAGIICRCHVHRPYGPAGGYQASDAFLRGNTQEITCAAGLRSGLRGGNVSRRRIIVAVASLVPVEVIVLIWLRHCASRVPQKWLGSRVTSVTFTVGGAGWARRHWRFVGCPHASQLSFRTGLKTQEEPAFRLPVELLSR